MSNITDLAYERRNGNVEEFTKTATAIASFLLGAVMAGMIAFLLYHCKRKGKKRKLDLNKDHVEDMMPLELDPESNKLIEEDYSE